MRAPAGHALALIGLFAIAAAPAAPAAAADGGADLAAAAAPALAHAHGPSLATTVRFDGRPSAPIASRAAWLQLHDELRRAAAAPRDWPDPVALRAHARALRRDGVIALGLIDVGDERLVAAPGRAFALAALTSATRRGASVTFALERALWFTDGARAGLELDLDDGRGFRAVAPGERVRAVYGRTGPRTLRARLRAADGAVREAAARFDVHGLTTPDPDDTLEVTASVPWQGTAGAGRAYVYLAPGRTALAHPIVVVEGFDLDDSMDWDELYASLNQEDLLETLRAAGHDAVVLDFDEATAPIQRNALLVAELLAQVQAAIHPSATVAVVGASMGGLCSRYALAWMESQAIPHRVRTWVSFDSPHLGANIPLGIQHWVDFFSGQSAEAAFLRDRLRTPAARQMLVYHYTSQPTSVGAPDPLRAALLADFAAVGEWPALTRRVAVANGSGAAIGQGFAAGAPIIRYAYGSALVSLRGHVWAIPEAVSDTIFDGHLRILFSTTNRLVTVSGAEPYDNAPGGSRTSMADMDSVEAPYGDIVALHPAHCFIPTVSAIALAGAPLFRDLSVEPDLAALTPFDAVRVAPLNEPHVTISAATAPWLAAELTAGTAGVGAGTTVARLALTAGPNPFAHATRLAFALPERGEVRLVVYDVTGREVRRLLEGVAEAGAHGAAWDGRDGAGRRVPAGLYVARLESALGVAAARLVRLD